MIKKIVAITVILSIAFLALLLYLFKIDSVLIKKPDSFNVAVILQSNSAAFWKDVADGAKSVKYNQLVLTVEGPDQETDFIKQASIINQAVEKKVDAIVIAPHNANVIVTALRRARSAQIPVIMIDSYLDIGELLPCVASDNDAIGEIAANAILQSGKVKRAIIIRGIWGDESQDQRSASAIKILRDAGVEIVAYENADSDREKAKQLTARLLEQYSGVQAIFATNDYMALGAADAEREAHYAIDLYIIGVDAIPEALQAIKLGIIDATVSQNAYEIGSTGVETAVNVLKKQNVPDRINIPSKLINKMNVNGK
ncbi:MAG: sugar ABC transporter substrate-binding protein [Negativicutes bacterium]|jgi:ribose transport system substrate-binding protein